MTKPMPKRVRMTVDFDLQEDMGYLIESQVLVDGRATPAFAAPFMAIALGSLLEDEPGRRRDAVLKLLNDHMEGQE